MQNLSAWQNGIGALVAGFSPDALGNRSRKLRCWKRERERERERKRERERERERERDALATFPKGCSLRGRTYGAFSSDHHAGMPTLLFKLASVFWRWYTLYNAVRTTCRTPPLDKLACVKKIKSVGIRPRCVQVNHTWRSGQFCRFFFFRSVAQSSIVDFKLTPVHGCRSSSQLWRHKRTLPESMQLARTAPLRTWWRHWTSRSCATNRSSTLCRSKSLPLELYSPAWRCSFQSSPSQPTTRSLTVTSPTAEAHARYFSPWPPGLESNVGGLFWALKWTEAHGQPSTGSSLHLLVARHAGNPGTDISVQGQTGRPAGRNCWPLSATTQRRPAWGKIRAAPSRAWRNVWPLLSCATRIGCWPRPVWNLSERSTYNAHHGRGCFGRPTQEAASYQPLPQIGRRRSPLLQWRVCDNRWPALAVNVVSVRRSALTSAGRSARPPTPSPRLQPSTPPATKQSVGFAEDGLIKPATSALLTAQNALRATGCIILLMSSSLGTTRFPYNLKTQCPRTRLMSTLAPSPQLTTLKKIITVRQDAGHSNQLHVRHIATHHRHTIAKPDWSRKPLPPLTPPLRNSDPRSTYKERTSVAPSSGSEHAARIACSWPVNVDTGANAVPFALCRIFQNRRSAVDSHILSSFSLSLSLSLSLSFVLFQTS